MRIGNAHLERSSDHELMPPSGNRSGKTERSKFSNPFSPGNRTGHSLRGLNGQTNAAHSRNGVAVSDLQYEPLFKDFLKYVAALRQSRLTRPHAGQTWNLTKAGAIFQVLVLGPSHRFVEVTCEHRLYDSANSWRLPSTFPVSAFPCAIRAGSHSATAAPGASTLDEPHPCPFRTAAEEHHLIAIEQTDTAPYRVSQPTAREWYALMLLERGETAKARGLLAEAMAMYESMGMPFHAKRARERLAQS